MLLGLQCASYWSREVTFNSVEALNSPIGLVAMKGCCSLHTDAIGYPMSLEGSPADHPINNSMF